MCAWPANKKSTVNPTYSKRVVSISKIVNSYVQGFSDVPIIPVPCVDTAPIKNLLLYSPQVYIFLGQA